MKFRDLITQQLSKNVVLIYAFLGALWVLCSDKVLHLFTEDKTLLLHLQVIKGWIFVLCSSWLLYDQISRLQRQQHQDKQKYTSFFNNAIEGIYQVLPSGNYLNANPALARIYGYNQPEELIANCCWQKLDIDKNKRTKFVQLLSNVGTVSGEVFEVYRKDGSIIFTVENACAIRDSQGLLLYYQGTVQEISKPQKKEIEKLPEESTSILHAVIEGMNDAVFVKNLDGQYLMTNESGAKFLGKSIDQVIGAHDWEVFPREIAQQIRESDLQVIVTRQTETYEQVVAIADADDYPVERTFIVSKSVYDDADGNTLGLISIARDLTNYKLVEEERYQLLEQLKKDTKDLAAITEITTNAASTLNLEQLLHMLLKQIGDVLAADTGVILLEENRYLRYTAGIGVSEEVSSNYLMPVGEGFAGTIAATMQPLYVEDPLNNPTVETLNVTSLQFILQLGIHTMLGVPLKRNGNCVGVIHLGWFSIHPYSEHEVHLLEITAERCAMAIVNTELYQQTQKLQKLRQLQIERMPIGFILADQEFHFLDWNPAAEGIFGFTKEEVLGKHLFTIVPSAGRTNFGIILLRLSQGDMTAHSVNENITKSGNIIVCEWRNTPLKEPDGKIFGYLFMVQDITELRKAQEEKLRYAFYDALTGLPNRAWFLEHLEKVLQGLKQGKEEISTSQLPASNYQFSNRNLAVLLLNLDRFEIVKSSLGHLIADRLLIATARQLETCLRQKDKVAYLGKNEFAILLENIEDASFAEKIADRIYQQLTLPFNIDGHEIFCSTRIGIALGATLWNCPDYERPEDFLRAADTAMHQVRGSGGQVVFEPAMHARALARLQLDTDLRRAIKRQEFHVYYQPIVWLQTGEISGFEALVRWSHPTKGMVSPAEFIPVAEETRLIIPIGDWILRSACEQLRIWQRQFRRSLTMSVNLSGIQLEQPNLVAQIEGILGEIWLAPNTLKLEITESTIMKNTETVTALLDQLKKMKIFLSIDDFGTGYSSLSYLHRFPVDTLKIDRSFVGRMCADSENLEIVRLIISLAHNLGMDVTAEGVENMEQLAQLQSLGCEFGQGYFFSKPLDKDAASALLEKHFSIAKGSGS